jgi:hypothetical protein
MKEFLQTFPNEFKLDEVKVSEKHTKYYAALADPPAAATSSTDIDPVPVGGKVAKAPVRAASSAGKPAKPKFGVKKAAPKVVMIKRAAPKITGVKRAAAPARGKRALK